MENTVCWNVQFHKFPPVTITLLPFWYIVFSSWSKKYDKLIGKEIPLILTVAHVTWWLLYYIMNAASVSFMMFHWQFFWFFISPLQETNLLTPFWVFSDCPQWNLYSCIEVIWCCSLAQTIVYYCILQLYLA